MTCRGGAAKRPSCKYEPPVQEVLVKCQDKALQKGDAVQDDWAAPEVLAKQDHPPDG